MTEITGAMRADTWALSVFVDGINYGIWDKKSGGEVDSDAQTYRPGAMADPVALGGSRLTGNVTLSRNARLGRDIPQSQALIEAVGKKTVRVVQQALDHDGHAWGKPFTYNGTLKRYTPPEADSTSNDAAMVEIEVTIEGFPTGMSQN